MTDSVDTATTFVPATASASSLEGSSRRTVLRAAGLVTLAGGAVALGACSSEVATSPTSAAPASSAPAASQSSAASPSAAESSSAAPSASATKTVPTGPSVSTADVPNGGGYIMPDADYVVTQPEKGTYKAFNKMCTHQGCPVSQITNREIVCKCHGSNFSIEDGSVKGGPAKAPLAEAKTTVSGNKIIITA